MRRIADVMEPVGVHRLRRPHPPPARGRVAGRDRQGRRVRRPRRRAGRGRSALADGERACGSRRSRCTSGCRTPTRASASTCGSGWCGRTATRAACGCATRCTGRSTRRRPPATRRLVARAVTAWDGAIFWSQHVYGATDLKLLEWIGVALRRGARVRGRAAVAGCWPAAPSSSRAPSTTRGTSRRSRPSTLARSLPDDGAATGVRADVAARPPARRRGCPRAATRSSRSCTTSPRSTSSGASTRSRTTCTSTTGSPAATSRRRYAARARRHPAGPAAAPARRRAREQLHHAAAVAGARRLRRRPSRRTTRCSTSSRRAALPQDGMRWACPFTVRHAQGRLAEVVDATRRAGRDDPRRRGSRRWSARCSRRARSTRRARCGTGCRRSGRTSSGSSSPCCAPSRRCCSVTMRSWRQAYDDLLPFAGWLAGGEGAVFALGPLGRHPRLAGRAPGPARRRPPALDRRPGDGQQRSAGRSGSPRPTQALARLA